MAPPTVTPPKQARSRRTLERIVRASIEILDQEGPDGLTVQAIVARADSSVGSFYARFAAKDDLLDYLGERVWREAAERWDGALASRDWSGLGLADVVDGSVRLLAEVERSGATVLQALGRAGPAPRDDAWRAFRAHVLGGVETLLLERAAEMTHPEPATGVRLGLSAALAVLEVPARTGPADAIPLERRVDEARALLLAYLAGAPAGPSPSPEQMDFFDVWA